MRALHYAWALPASLLGLAIGLLALALGARIAVAQGCLEIGGGVLGRHVSRLPSRLRFGAMTLGHVIIGTDCETLVRCRAHEQVHVRQYERWGPLFFPLYLGSSLIQLIRGKDPYRDNRFEREAYSKAP